MLSKHPTSSLFTLDAHEWFKELEFYLVSVKFKKKLSFTQ